MKRILIVDDEPEFIVLMKNRLSKNGYEILTASDGLAGLNLAQKEKPDLIILDIMLPHMDGYKVCGLLKNDARFKNIPIILFSAKAHQRDANLAKDVSANAYLTKLEDSKQLMEQIKELIGDAKAQ